VNRRTKYRLSRDSALVVLCALTDWNDQYLSKARETIDAQRALSYAREADDGLNAYIAVLNAYGWNEHHRTQVKRWREAISDIRIRSAKATRNEATDNGR
jgi:hypothetical protein